MDIPENFQVDQGYLPARYVLSFLLLWAMCLEYAQRVCLSVTIVAMVNHTALDAAQNLTAPQNGTSVVDDSCPVSDSVNVTQPEEDGDYLWTPSVQGVILGAYFYGYVLTQVAGGRMAEVAGGKWVLGLAVATSSLITLATPVIADVGVVTLVISRVVMGMLHGVCMPTAFALFAHWAPLEERTTLLGLCHIGDHVGTILTMPLTGYLCEYGFAGGWPSVYYILGIIGFVWFFFWCLLAYNRPEDHPRISKIEIYYIKKGQIQITDGQKFPVPWKSVLGSSSVWTVAIVSFCSAWGFTTLLTKLPTYLEVVLHVPIQKNGLVNSLIYTSTCITILLSSYLSDYFRSKKHMNPTKVRKTFEIIGMAGPALCTALIPLMRCNRIAVISLLTGAMAFLGFTGGGHASIAADMAPHHAASVFGFINSFASIAGIFSPLLAGFLLDNARSSIDQWSVIYYISSGMNLLGGAIFLFGASAQIQPWACRECKEKLLTTPPYDTHKERLTFLTAAKDPEQTYGAIS